MKIFESLIFAELASFDGTDQPVIGQSEIRFGGAAGAPSLHSIQRRPGGAAELMGAVEAGHIYVIEATSDFVQWSEVTRLAPSEKAFQYTDQPPQTEGQRFYRIKRVVPGR